METPSSLLGQEREKISQRGRLSPLARKLVAGVEKHRPSLRVRVRRPNLSGARPEPSRDFEAQRTSVSLRVVTGTHSQERLRDFVLSVTEKNRKRHATCPAAGTNLSKRTETLGTTRARVPESGEKATQRGGDDVPAPCSKSVRIHVNHTRI